MIANQRNQKQFDLMEALLPVLGNMDRDESTPGLVWGTHTPEMWANHTLPVGAFSISIQHRPKGGRRRLSVTVQVEQVANFRVSSTFPQGAGLLPTHGLPGCDLFGYMGRGWREAMANDLAAILSSMGLSYSP